MAIIRNRSIQCGLAAICLLPVFILSSLEATVCSWDYLIWMPRSKYADPLYRFIRNGKAGYIDRSGKVVIEPQFSFYGNSGNEFRDGLMEIGISDGKYVDTTGKLVIDKGFHRGWDFSEGLAAVRVGSKWGYIDKNGRMAIKPQFDKASPFSDELAAVEQGGLHGYIDRTGAIVIAPQFKQAGQFSDGLAAVGVWNEKERSYDEYFYINKQGEQAIPERFALASYFFKGLAHVKIKTSTGKITKAPDADGSFAYIDVTGKKVFSY